MISVIVLFVIFDINPFRNIKNIKDHLKPKEKKPSVKSYMKSLEGTRKENIFKRSAKQSKKDLQMIGEENRYKTVKKVSVLLGILSAIIIFAIFKLPLLAIVIGLGCGLLPLWMTKLSVYKYNENLNNELETSLSLITVSYQRTHNIVLSIEENVHSSKYPLNKIFSEFLQTLDYVEFNKVKAIEDMKEKLDNVLFREWCDVLILCEEDSSLIAGLTPVIDKLGLIKQEQEYNKTLLMLPVSQTRNMVLLTIAVVPLLYISNRDWYSYLVGTTAGQIAMCFVAIIIFLTIEKTINLIKPIEYKL